MQNFIQKYMSLLKRRT